jgi:hypothetical protein
MKRRRSEPTELPTKEDLTRLGLPNADPDDPMVQRLFRMKALMGQVQAPRPHVSTKHSPVAQARSNKAKLPDLAPIRRELAALWSRWEIGSQEARKSLLKQIAPWEKQYFWIEDHMPAQERPAKLGYSRVWHGRVYSASPKGLDFMEALSLLNQFLPLGHAHSDAEERDRFIAYLWALRRHGAVTVGVPVSRGKPKSRCVDCGDIHLDSKRTKELKLLGCPRCGSLVHKAIDPTHTKPGTERTFRITRKELCRRFRISRQHLRTIVGRYSPAQTSTPEQ